MREETTGIKRLFTRELVAIITISATGFFSQNLLSPVLPLYLRGIGITDQNIGLVFSVMMIGIAISEVLWGWAVDRIDLRIVLFLGTVAYGIVTTFLMIPKTLSLFLIIIFIYGFSRSPVYIVGRWYMGVYAPNDIKAQAFAILMVMISISTSLAGFTSGYITEAWGFRNTIWLAAAVPVIAGLLLIVSGRWLNFQKPKPTQELSGSEASEPVSVDGNTKFTTFFLGSFGVIMFISLGILMTYLPLFASDVVHLDPSEIGILFGLRGIIQILIIMPLGRLADKVGKSLFIPLGMSVVALSMIVVAISRDYAMLLISVFLFSSGAGMYFPSVSAILAERVPVTWVGTAMGIYGLLEDVGWMIGPAVAGLLLNYWGLQSPFVFGGIVALLGIPLFLWGRRRMLV